MAHHSVYACVFGTTCPLSFCCVFTPKKSFSYLLYLAHSINIFILFMYSSWCVSRVSKMVSIASCEQYIQYDCIWVLRLTASSLSPAKLSSPNTGLQNPMSSVGVGQPSAPTINTSTPIDPSSMQRAYAALGLPYSSQATAQAQTQQAPGPGQTAGSQNAQAQQQQQLPQQMRPINALGKKFLLLYYVWALL